MLDLNSSNNDTSIAMDLLRALAAQAVCVGHALSFFGLQGRAARMQIVGVEIFFLLSGLLIAYTLVTKAAGDETYSFGSYFIDRFARIYSGLVPALIFVLLADAVMLAVGSYDLYEQYSVSAFFGTLEMRNGYAGIWRDAIATHSFGSGGPFWTLAVEFHIYLFVGALFFLLRGSRNIVLVAIGLFFAQLPLWYLYGQSGDGKGIFALWLAGFAIAFIVGAKSFNVRPSISAAVCLIALLIFLSKAKNGREYAVNIYPWLVLSFGALVAATNRVTLPIGNRTRAVIRFLAGYSFMLYLIHYTVLYGLERSGLVQSWAGFFVGVVVANLVAAIIAMPTEMQYKHLARSIKGALRSIVLARAGHSGRR